MDCFEDQKFDAVLCNAVLEHDKYFWKTIAEIKRVTKPDGLIVIGTPGYKRHKAEKRIKSFFKKIPLFRSLSSNQYLNFFFSNNNFRDACHAWRLLSFQPASLQRSVFQRH